MNEDNWYKFLLGDDRPIGHPAFESSLLPSHLVYPCIGCGIPPALIAAAGGHADISVAYKNYIHTPTKELIEAAQKI